MQRFFRFVVLASVVLSLLFVGCKSSSSVTNNAANNSFVGTWQGVWKFSSLTSSGLITFSVNSDGTTTGTVENFSGNTTSTISGNLSSSGAFTGTMLSGQTTTSLSMTLLYGTNGLINGNISQIISNQTYSGTFVAHATVSSSNKYAGSWTGTWNNITESTSGNAAISITSSGLLIGTLLTASSLPFGILSEATVDSFGNFSGKLQLTAGNYIAISGNLGTISGNQTISSVAFTNNSVDEPGTFNLQHQ
ncbi:MAG: hypothetical protein HQM08_24855 [Candidatus Riflebacteria bacterium]|nr:hypothetical protein [Candidatus Riflebacteria bacterium]